MAEQHDDLLFDPNTPATVWDDDEWEWE